MKHLLHVSMLWLVISLTACSNMLLVARRGTPMPRSPTMIATNNAGTLWSASQTDKHASCPATPANHSMPPGEKSGPGRYTHGNGRLWVEFGPENPKTFIYPDDRFVKFGWWRGPMAQGKLTIEGRRLDAPASPLAVSIPDGYGDTGFQASGILFPSEGCWAITGKAGNASLTFVTWVVKVPESK